MADASDAPFEPALPARLAPALDLARRLFRHSVEGLERIPTHGPALLVLNHGPLPVDALLLCRALHVATGRWPRFLGERRVFESPFLAGHLARWGVVEGTHASARRCFARGELVAVFPGGAREAWKPYRERRGVRWAGRTGFARLAFKAGVPIVPVACPAAATLYVLLNDGMAWGERVFGASWGLPLPLGFGLGLAPFPRRLVHHVGVPIDPVLGPDETADVAVERLHVEVEQAMRSLLGPVPK